MSLLFSSMNMLLVVSEKLLIFAVLVINDNDFIL